MIQATHIFKPDQSLLEVEYGEAFFQASLADSGNGSLHVNTVAATGAIR